MSSPRTHRRSCVLIVESNALIGLDLADDLEEQGYETAGPYACAAALTWLESRTPDAAILDVDLQSGPCVGLARELKRRGVSVVVYSAHEQRLALPEFHDVPWVSMPASREMVRQALNGLPCG